MAPTPVKVSGTPCAAYALVDANDLARAPPASLCVVLLLGCRPDKEAGGGPQGWGKLERAEVQHTYLETTGAILNVQVVLVRFRHGEGKKQSFSIFGGRAARFNFDTEVVSPPVPRIHSLLYTGGDPSWPAPRRGILWHLREARERRERSQPATLAFSSMGDSVNTRVQEEFAQMLPTRRFLGSRSQRFPPVGSPETGRVGRFLARDTRPGWLTRDTHWSMNRVASAVSLPGAQVDVEGDAAQAVRLSTGLRGRLGGGVGRGVES